MSNIIGQLTVWLQRRIAWLRTRPKIALALAAAIVLLLVLPIPP